MASKNKQNAIDLALKLKLETQLAKSMRIIFRAMSEEMRVYYIKTQQLFDTRKYDGDIASELRYHYKKVAKNFDDRLRESFKKCFHVSETKQIDDKISHELNSYFYKRALEQTSFISQTNLEESYKSFQKSVLNAAKRNKATSKEELAKEASQDFLTKGLGRAGTIGQTETQNAAEKTKDIEAESMLGENDIVAGGVLITPDNVVKTWSAILDDRTRLAHVEADDQTVPQDAPFIVAGESLMYPGDDSLGASLENIINCRCNTSRAIELTELPSFTNHPTNRAPRRGFLHFP